MHNAYFTLGNICSLTDFGKNINVVMLINSLTFRNLVKLYNAMNMMMICSFQLFWFWWKWILPVHRLTLRFRVINNKKENINRCMLCFLSNKFGSDVQIERVFRFFLILLFYFDVKGQSGRDVTTSSFRPYWKRLNHIKTKSRDKHSLPYIFFSKLYVSVAVFSSFCDVSQQFDALLLLLTFFSQNKKKTTLMWMRATAVHIRLQKRKTLHLKEKASR